MAPARNALPFGRSPGRDWRPGRPLARWTDQLRNDTGFVPANQRCSSGPWWSDATARAGDAMTITKIAGRSGPLR